MKISGGWGGGQMPPPTPAAFPSYDRISFLLISSRYNFLSGGAGGGVVQGGKEPPSPNIQGTPPLQKKNDLSIISILMKLTICYRTNIEIFVILNVVFHIMHNNFLSQITNFPLISARQKFFYELYRPICCFFKLPFPCEILRNFFQLIFVKVIFQKSFIICPFSIYFQKKLRTEQFSFY